MRCSRCGTTLMLGEKFCGECGTPRPDLPPPFETTEKKFLQLRSRLQEGEIDQGAYQKALEALVVEDEAGRFWMIGEETGQWYRYDGTEWQQQDPPEAKPPRSAPPPPANRTQAAPVSTKRHETPAAMPPKAAHGQSRRWLFPVAGCFLVLLLTCAAGLLFRESLANAAVNFALSQGWGTVIEPTEAAYSLQATPTIPQRATPVSASPAPTQVPTRSPTKAPTKKPAPSPIPAWSTVPCTIAGLTIPVPPGYVGKAEDEGLAYIYNPAMTIVMRVECVTGSAGQSLETQMAAWLTTQKNLIKGPIIGKTAVGPLAITVAKPTDATAFYAMIGPTATNSLVYLTGTTTGEWAPAEAIFDQIAQGIEYAE